MLFSLWLFTDNQSLFSTDNSIMKEKEIYVLNEKKPTLLYCLLFLIIIINNVMLSKGVWVQLRRGLNAWSFESWLKDGFQYSRETTIPPPPSLLVSSLLFCQSFSSCHAWLVALLGVKTLWTFWESLQIW